MVRVTVSLLAVAASCALGSVACSPAGAQAPSQSYLDQLLKGTPAQRERDKVIGDYYADQHRKADEYKQRGKQKLAPGSMSSF